MQGVPCSLFMFLWAAGQRPAGGGCCCLGGQRLVYNKVHVGSTDEALFWLLPKYLRMNKDVQTKSKGRILVLKSVPQTNEICQQLFYILL